MSVVPLIYNGMTGKKDAEFRMPTMQTGDVQLANKNPLLGFTKDVPRPNILPASIDYSTRRGIMPCKVINRNVLRAPPVEASNAYQVSQGYARDQPVGLAYLPQHKLNARIMPQASSFSAAMNNPLGQPA
jgi:hypothetical protein